MDQFPKYTHPSTGTFLQRSTLCIIYHILFAQESGAVCYCRKNRWNHIDWSPWYMSWQWNSHWWCPHNNQVCVCVHACAPLVPWKMRELFSLDLPRAMSIILISETNCPRPKMAFFLWTQTEKAKDLRQKSKQWTLQMDSNAYFCPDHVCQNPQMDTCGRFPHAHVAKSVRFLQFAEAPGAFFPSLRVQILSRCSREVSAPQSVVVKTHQVDSGVPLRFSCVAKIKSKLGKSHVFVFLGKKTLENVSLG